MQIPSVAAERKQQLISNSKPQNSKPGTQIPTPVPAAEENEVTPSDKGTALDLKA
jgi:hypothetical protein